MPTIFDNIEQKFLPALQKSLQVAYRADFCIGYFSVKGWKNIANDLDHFQGGENHCCRVLIGMAQTYHDWKVDFDLVEEEIPDSKTMRALELKTAEEFRLQLVRMLPTNHIERELKQLLQQLKSAKVKIRLYLRHPLHAKLYLTYRNDDFNPLISYLGSSNLTLSGLSNQGELNVNVETKEAGEKLTDWFNARWNDNKTVDISDALIHAIEQSWVEQTVTPYEVYLKIAYHLSADARMGMKEFFIPRQFRKKLFTYQENAIQLAARHLEKRNGVLLADVVGLGKTLMATVLAKIFEEIHRLETLIICPKNLVTMWSHYCDQYLKMVRVLSISQVEKELPELKRYHLVIIDESHHLRHQEGKRYKAIRSYLVKNESKVILLSATPYNKDYSDLVGQLGLFIDMEDHLEIKPRKLLANPTKEERDLLRHCSEYSLKAFAISQHPEDWRDLMRLYMVRRTRSFIQKNYSEFDVEKQRYYLLLEDNNKSFFPKRQPKTLRFPVIKNTVYARLINEDTIELLNNLHLPRYGLGSYVTPTVDLSKEEQQIISDLRRSGRRLMGFYRINLFKRLESSEKAFFYSLKRHLLRNLVMLYALENDLSVPLGTELIEINRVLSTLEQKDKDEFQSNLASDSELLDTSISLDHLRRHAKELYELARSGQGQFRWLSARQFSPLLITHLQDDVNVLFSLFKEFSQFTPAQDSKLQVLAHLIQQVHPTEKILIFTQFADTAIYLEQSLLAQGIVELAAVTGQSESPSEFAMRFSPKSYEKIPDAVAQLTPLRILITTDVLSEGQNLQDAAIVVNYDLPWAIIRLIQRVGRVDRIGQQADTILCYSFLPDDGVEKLIRLRQRLKQRLQQNAEVIGTDEAFFEDDMNKTVLLDLYHEKSNVLEHEKEQEIDLVSEAHNIWSKAIKENPSLEKRIMNLPNHIYANKAAEQTGTIVYFSMPNGSDMVALIDAQEQIITDSPEAILQAAFCTPDTPALPRDSDHFERIKVLAKLSLDDAQSFSGFHFKRSVKGQVYRRLSDFRGGLLLYPNMSQALELLLKYPLCIDALELLRVKLKQNCSDESLLESVMSLFQEKRLCVVHENAESNEFRVICSLGLRA
ncbi:helicase-related protein [Thioflexithrix psekupsensis]|uniref:NgoFVII family restriction endonuclease n=1 Tax=Thioflexithrix psekupsensis TaxID=1570016 RepID=A0A251X7C3_9GAMM|nr:helicase-related protein [Thioflexithrix psekupsensis]OUD13881.1 NgoFVII family restriction endonuclease [Thioflexithrix psekupsensis]